MARYVAEDTEYAGCPMKKGDKILMAFPAGNRDPEHFDRPDEFIIDRQRNRHFAFGSGIHRCLGSNLARMELRVAIERFLTASPPSSSPIPTRSRGAAARSAARVASRCAGRPAPDTTRRTAR